MQLLNDPGRVYCKDDHGAVGNFAALFKVLPSSSPRLLSPPLLPLTSLASLSLFSCLKQIHNTTTNETALILSFRGIISYYNIKYSPDIVLSSLSFSKLNFYPPPSLLLSNVKLHRYLTTGSEPMAIGLQHEQGRCPQPLVWRCA